MLLVPDLLVQVSFIPQYLQTAFGTSPTRTRSGSKCSHTFDLLPCGVAEGASTASPVPELSDTFADMLKSLAVKIRDIEKDQGAD
jgi:hypothetical protein